MLHCYSKFHPFSQRRHTVSVDNLEELDIDELPSDDDDDDDDDSADTEAAEPEGKHCCLFALFLTWHCTTLSVVGVNSCR